MRISDWSSDVCSSDLRRWITLRMEGRSVAGLLTRSARLLPFLLKRGAGPLVGDVERLSQDLRQRVVHRHVACQVTKHLSRLATIDVEAGLPGLGDIPELNGHQHVPHDLAHLRALFTCL